MRHTACKRGRSGESMGGAPLTSERVPCLDVTRARAGHVARGTPPPEHAPSAVCHLGRAMR